VESQPPCPPAPRADAASIPARRWRADGFFFLALALVGGSYVVLMALLLGADVLFITPEDVRAALLKPEIRFAIRQTLFSCSIAAVLSVIVATPLGYLLARCRFPGRWCVELLVDLPIVLPPLVVGLSLLILFHLRWGDWRLEDWLRNTCGIAVTYHLPAVILAQFAVGCAFAIRTLKLSFAEINPRAEQVARTLGCSRAQTFWLIALPQASRGLVTAATIAWARSLGEFGPILVFAGMTRGKTEVLSSTVYLELSVGNLEAAVAVSLLMVALAAAVLCVLRALQQEPRR
jgi:molybdate transport system permease protein